MHYPVDFDRDVRQSGARSLRIQFDGTKEGYEQIAQAFDPSRTRTSYAKSEYMVIETLEGKHTACPKDWIIRGVAGELYPCKPDIFERTYEPAAPPASE